MIFEQRRIPEGEHIAQMISMYINHENRVICDFSLVDAVDEKAPRVSTLNIDPSKPFGKKQLESLFNIHGFEFESKMDLSKWSWHIRDMVNAVYKIKIHRTQAKNSKTYTNVKVLEKI